MTQPLINRLTTAEIDFLPSLDKLTAWHSVSDSQVNNLVADIIQQVQSKGDQALLSFTNKFDRRSCQNIQQLCLGKDQLKSALETIDTETRIALETAAARITEYHQHQLQESWQYQQPDGTILGQQVTPLERVGLYVPGGKASYPHLF